MSVRRLSPPPALIIPYVAARIASVFDKGGVFPLCHRRPGNGERLHLDRVCPLFIVEDEWFGGSSSEKKLAAGDLRVARERAGGRAGWCVMSVRDCHQPRRRIAQRLAGVGERL